MRIVRPMTVQDANLLSSNVLEDDYTAWSSGTTYAAGDFVRVVSTNVHKIFQSLQSANLNHAPVGGASDTWWSLVGMTNRWRMFDQSNTSETTNADSIDVELQTSGRTDAVALMNINCASIHVTMTDLVDGVVYDKTFSGVSTDGIGDAYAYCFEPIERIKDFALHDMPLYNAAKVRITLTDTGGTARCGTCVLGLSREIGGVQQGASVGIQDYSVKTKDSWGNYSITERAFNKRANFSIYVEPNSIDKLQNMLAQYRATPIVYIGSDRYGSMLIYGFYKDFSVVVQYAALALCNLELEGLT